MDFLSVFIYLATFALSLLCLFFSQTFLYGSSGNRNPLLGNIFLVVAIFIPCFLASLRGLSVGEDIDTYILPVTDYSSDIINKGFQYFYENIPYKMEIGFAYILYLGLIFNNIGLSFFFMQFLSIFPLYLTLVNFRKDISVTMGMAIYFFLNYNFSLSGMRVSIAMSIILLMTFYLYSGKYIKAILSSVIATLFHDSAIIIALLIGIVFYFLKKGISRKALSLFVLAGIVISFFINELLELLFFLIGSINGRYLNYLLEHEDKGGFFLTDFFSKMFLIVLVVCYLKRQNKSFLFQLFFVMCILGRLLVLINVFVPELLRVAYYFDMFLILFTAMALKSVGNNSVHLTSKFYSSIILLIPPIVYWLHFIMNVGAYGSNVYSFR